MKTIYTLIAICFLLFAHPAKAQTPGYLGKKWIVATAVGMTPRIDVPRGEFNEAYSLLNPLDLRYSGLFSLERIISRKGSLYLNFEQTTIYIPNELRLDMPLLRLPFGRENYSNSVRNVGLKYRIYSDIAPLRYFVGLGINLISYETPNYRIGQSEEIFGEKRQFLMGSIEFGATKIYRDRFVVTYAIGSNMRRFNLFILFEEEYMPEDFKSANEALSTRTSFYTTKNLGIYARFSVGYVF